MFTHKHKKNKHPREADNLKNTELFHFKWDYKRCDGPAAHFGEKSPPGKRRERKVGMFSRVFWVAMGFEWEWVQSGNSFTRSYHMCLMSALVAVEQWLLLAVHVRVGHTKSLPLTSNFDSLDSAQLILNPNFLDAAHHPLLNSQFSILNSKF